MEGPIVSPPTIHNIMWMVMLTNLTKGMTTMPLLVLQMDLLISLQINLLLSNHPTNLHHNSPLLINLFHNSPLHSSLFHANQPLRYFTNKWSIGAISSLNSQANLRKMLKHIFHALMTGCRCIILRKM